MTWFAKLAAAAAAVCSLGILAPTAWAAEQLNLFAWSEYIPQSVLDGFKEETGITVNYETYDSNEVMLGKLMAGGAKYDLIQPSEYVVEALVREGRLLPLDHAKLPNLKNLDPLFTQQAHDPGLKYSIPYMSGVVGIIYNSEKIKEPIKGYNDVFSGKYAGRILVMDDGREIVSWVLATLGKECNDITDETLAAVKPVMTNWARQIKIYDSDSPKDKLINGDVDVGIVWSGEGAILLNDESGKFKWTLPAEGGHRFIDCLAIPKDAPNAEAAHKFINYILRPDVSKMISDEFPYTNPNAEARKLLDEKARSNPASYPANSEKLQIFKDIGQISTKVDELYTAIKSQ